MTVIAESDFRYKPLTTDEARAPRLQLRRPLAASRSRHQRRDERHAGMPSSATCATRDSTQQSGTSALVGCSNTMPPRWRVCDARDRVNLLDCGVALT